MRGCVLGITIGSLALCMAVAAFGIFVAWPKLRTAVSESQAAVTAEMADAVFLSVSRRIQASEIPAGGQIGGNELVLTATDLNVNNVVVPGEVGVETGTFGTRIYGIVTEIGVEGISLELPGVTYSGVPVVEDGRVELTQIQAGDDVLGFIFSEDIFEQSMEEGMNRALEAHALRPISISLRHGSMTILTERAVTSG